MYLPKHFEVTDQATIDAFVRANPFATLVSVIGGGIFATHVPMLADGDLAAGGVLLGHVAKANDHIRAFDGASESLMIFQGPHAYVSPTWYASSPAVPTWNYSAVHVYGVLSPMTRGETARFVGRLTDHFEGSHTVTASLPPDYKADMVENIVGFRLAISRVEAKFKMSQNRPAEDAPRVVDRLSRSDDAASRELSDLMSSHLRLDTRQD
jgi:transcriptional regulator